MIIMILVLQAITAFFAVIGIFEVVWQIILFWTKKSVHCKKSRIVLETDEFTNPDLLIANLRLVSDQLCACMREEIWIVSSNKDPKKRGELSRILSRKYDCFHLVTPEEFLEELQLDYASQDTSPCPPPDSTKKR